MVDQLAHRNGAGIPTACDYLTVDAATRCVGIDVKWLWIPLLGEGDHLVLLDVDRTELVTQAYRVVLEEARHHRVILARRALASGLT